MGRVALDTGVLIAGMRRDLASLTDTDDIAIPTVVIAEFLVGVELDQDHERAALSRDYLDALLEVAPILEYTRDVASHHAALLAHTRRTGQPCGAHDLIIAATARAAGRTVATTDQRAQFDTLPNIECLMIPAA